MKKLIVVLMALGFVFVVSTASIAGHDCEGKNGKGHTSHGNGKGNGHSNSDPGEGPGPGPSDPGPGPSDPGPSDPTGPAGPGSNSPKGSGSSGHKGGEGSAYGQDFCDSLDDKYIMPEYCAIVE